MVGPTTTYVEWDQTQTDDLDLKFVARFPVAAAGQRDTGETAARGKRDRGRGGFDEGGDEATDNGTSEKER